MSKLTRKEFEQSSYLAGANAGYIEELYEQFLQNPELVDGPWREYFNTVTQQNGGDVSHQQIRERFLKLASESHGVQQAPIAADVAHMVQQSAVTNMIINHRRFGHFNAKIDPLGKHAPDDPRLQLSFYNLSQADFNTEFETSGLLEKPRATLKEIYDTLKSVYCGSIGFEYSTIPCEEERHWVRDYAEHKIPNMQYSQETKLNILSQLTASEILEKFLDMKYVGQKRFSIEGADALIPMLDELAYRARKQGMKEIVIGMAHRGRLNVLLNVMGHSPKELFLEFEGKKDYGMTSGDVKYHRGYSRDVLTDAGPLHLALAFNPSHLEFINPVIMGSVRARQRRYSDEDRRNSAMPVQIHGDAAFAAQGIVMETLSMSQTRAHSVGGSLHIVVNNQIGFTTSNPLDARSSEYCSDVAKMINAPVLHVNGDDPEAAIATIQMALDYRMTFHKDIVIDLVCYRRHGHQEVDEPTATQPLMYQIIKKHPTTRKFYADQLIQEKVCTEAEAKAMIDDYRAKLDAGEQVVQTLKDGLSNVYAEKWTKYIGQVWTMEASTAVDKNTLIELGKEIATYPESFQLQRQVDHLMKGRAKMATGEMPMDWGFAENLAYATLLAEEHPVRLVGEDARRGTFYHRHAVVHDQLTGQEYMPLTHMPQRKAKVEVYDSLLSEAGALGFEYGYSTASPDGLVIWEAQFGDFANGAQVIIDQFISSGWQKWNRLSGLAMLLPHGYEGMGPEHSSARMERYLQLCAQYNIQVCVPTTPAQIFHLLRRQVVRPFRKPLIVMSPKSLLRHKLATSTLDELAQGEFQLIIPEVDQLEDAKVTRIILCSGKVYYDLLEKRRQNSLNHIAIIRIEQLYPFGYDECRYQLARYPNANEVIWCQEEPKNQGAWFCSRDRFLECKRDDQTLTFVGRDPSAAPAAGYPALHKKQQQTLINTALGLPNHAE